MNARLLVAMFLTGCALPAAVLLSAVPAGLPSPDATPPAVRHARANVGETPAASASVAANDASLPVSAVESVGITVSDMDRAVDFYTRVLSFVPVSDVEVAGRRYELLNGVFGARMRVVTLRLGDDTLQLTEYLTPKGRRIPDEHKPNDLAFQHIAIIVSDMGAAYGRLRAAGVEHASTGPQRLPDWNPNAGGIQAFYFRDPDRHFLELLQFPVGKGRDTWHRKDRLFLGIDHTAIVVSDTERSLAFYRDRLRMTVAGESENHGSEQEHLNNVFGARLRITAVRAGDGPGIEFLEYLAPGTGRPAPPDLAANDVLHWQTTLRTESLAPLFRALRSRTFRLVSPGAIPFADGPFTAAVVLRDPDGHGVQLTQARERTTGNR